MPYYPILSTALILPRKAEITKAINKDNVYSQHQVLPQAKYTMTLGRNNPQKLTLKTQNQKHRYI